MRSSGRRSVVTVLVGAFIGVHASARPASLRPSGAPASPTLSEAQHLFYSGCYEAAAATALALRSPDAEDLAGYELRTSALHFQIKRALGDAANKSKAFSHCVACPALMSDFLDDTAHGETLARRTLRTNPQDESALFFLGKLNLNFVWLQLGTLGRRTGWDEYWEARRSLDQVLKRNPGHVRARVARAWIDYIVDTKLPRGTKWLVSGGSKKRALLAVREAANAEADVFAQAEAGFALWDMEVREGNIPEAIVVAQRLARDFPANQDLIRFLDAHDTTGTPDMLSLPVR